MSVIGEMLSYPFLVRALVGGVLVSLCAALLGVSLVLKRYSMIGDGLSHVSFGALSIALAMGWSPLQVSIPVVVIAAFFLLRITENSRLNSDAAIAVISASALAGGITVTALTTGMTTDVSSYMFGSILAMSREDVILSAILSAVVLFLFIFFYHKVFAVTFDENFARATGVRVGWYHILFAVLTAVTIVLGMRMMGAMLISSLIIFPALTAMRLFKSFRGVILAAGGDGGGLLLCGAGDLLPGVHPGGGQRGAGQPGSLSALLGGAEDPGQIEDSRGGRLERAARGRKTWRPVLPNREKRTMIVGGKDGTKAFSSRRRKLL